MAQRFLVPMKTPQIDLLHQWATRVRVAKSEMNPKRWIQLSEERLNEVIDFFRGFFGEEFFTPEPMEIIIPVIKVKDSHWFLQLLINDDYSSLLQIFETEYLLKKIKDVQPTIYKQLRSNKGDQGFRNYLFEAILFTLLADNNIPYEGKKMLGRKEKEGFFTVAGQKALFECKKLYTYRLPGIDFIMNIHEEFFRKWMKRPFSLNGYISIKDCTEPEMRAAKNVYQKAFKDYFARVKRTGDVDYQAELTNEAGKTVGAVLFEKYHQGIFEHQRQLISDSNTAFMIKPPDPTMINDQLMHIHNTRIQFHFNISTDLSEKTLLAMIDKKRASQSDTRDMLRIFFFDNEIYRGTEFGLFMRPEIRNEQKIIDYLNAKETKDVICILFREYPKGELPNWQFKIFCKPELEHIKAEIEKWKMLYKNPDFFNHVPKYKAGPPGSY
jgi:hypothetical protein